jgi:hypothetical protein
MFSAHSLWACTRFYEKQELTDEIVFDQIMDYFFHSLSPSAALATTAPSKS